MPWERAEEEFSHSEGASWGKIQEISAALEKRKAGRGVGGAAAMRKAGAAGSGHCLACSTQAQSPGVTVCWWALWLWGRAAAVSITEHPTEPQISHKKCSALTSSTSAQCLGVPCPHLPIVQCPCCCTAPGKGPAQRARAKEQNPVRSGGRQGAVGCPVPCPEPWGGGGSAEHDFQG